MLSAQESRHKEHHNSGPNPKHGVMGQSLPASGSLRGAGLPHAHGVHPMRGRAKQRSAAPARHSTASPGAPGSRDPSPERCRAGRQGQVRQPPSPHAGQTFRRCHSALPSSRASSDFLLILRQRGGKRAGTSAGGGVVFWENKSSVAACCGPGDARGWRSSPLTGVPSLGAASVGAPAALQGAPGPGTPSQTPASPAIPCLSPWLWVPVCASLAPSCKDGGTGCAPGRGSPLAAPQAEGESCRNGKRKIPPSSP